MYNALIHLRGRIADKIAEKVKECYRDQGFSTVTLKDGKEIVGEEIDEYARMRKLEPTEIYASNHRNHAIFNYPVK